MQSTFLLMSSRQLYEHFRGDYQTHDIGWSEEQASTVLQTWQRRFVQVSVGREEEELSEAVPSSCPRTLTLSLQLAQEALPANASQQIHAFSSTSLDDILLEFSEVSAPRVVGGYLLMVGPASSNLASPPAGFHPGNPCLRLCPVPTAGLCLCDHATVGLCPVPGRRRSRRSVAGGPGSGLRPWALCPAWHHFQCCYYSGRPGPGVSLRGGISRLHGSSR